MAQDSHLDEDQWASARRAAGDARVDAFLASVAPETTVPDAGTAEELADRALTSRDALEEMLRAYGIEDDAARLAHDVAEEGLLLEPGSGRSRLGGAGLLPAGTAWPQTTAGQPLTFLAGIDLAELPPGGPLPGSGWLLFFAALDPEEEEMVGEAETGHRVLFAGEVCEAESPGEPLDERRVGFRRVLTIPGGYRAGLQIGLDVYASETYDEVIEALDGALDPDQHWIGGHATGVQGEPPEPGTYLLLHMGWDTDIGFEFLDGGAIQFRIPLDALAARDFSRAFAYADSA